MTLGDLKFTLGLDLKPYAESLKTAIRLGQAAGKSIDDALKLKPPTAGITHIDAELKKLDNTLKQIVPDAKKVATETTQMTTQISKGDAAVKQKTNSLKGMASELRQLSRMMRLFTGGFIAQLLNPIKQFVDESIQQFAKLEQANRLLLTRLGGDRQKFSELNNQSLSGPKVFDLASVKDSQGIFSGVTNDTDSIKQLVKVATDYAVVSGKNLPDASKILLASLNGDITALKELDPRFAQLTKTQLANGDAIRLVGELTAGATDQFVQGAGKLKVYENQWNEVKAAFGEGLFTSVMGELDTFNSSLDGTGSSITKLAKGIGEAIVFIAKWATIWGVVITAIKGVKFTLDLLGTSLKDIRNSILDANREIANLPSKLPIIGQFYDKIKNKANEYLDKLKEIINAQSNMGGAINDNKKIQYNSQGNQVTTGQGDKNPVRGEGVNNTKSNSGSNTQALQEEKEELDEVAKKKEDLIKLQARYNDAVSKGYKGLASDLKLQIDELNKEIERLINGIEQVERKLANRGANGKQNDYAEGATKPGNEPTAQLKPDENAWMQYWTVGLNYAKQIMDILNKRPENLFQTFMQIMGVVGQIAGMLIPGAGGLIGAITGIFGTIGNILGFNKGTDPVVPGSGNTDSVLAKLTPGEVVINKPRVNQLVSQFGLGFIKWLNGGGSLLPAIPGHYNTGGIVQNIIQEKRSLRNTGDILLNGKIIDDRAKRDITSSGLVLESMSSGNRDI